MKNGYLCSMNTTTAAPLFSAFLFWDSNPDKIDFDRDASYIIRRVFDMGRLEDVAETMRYYPEKLLIDTLLQANYLPENAVSLAVALFQLDKKDFKCCS